MTTMTQASCAELLAAMVQFDTVNSNITGKPDAEKPLAEFLEKIAKAANLTTRRMPVSGNSFNLLITHEVNRSAPWLMFESHIDTVSVAGMTVDPFGAKIEGGKMFGRGACDTKSSGAAMLWAMMAYSKKGGPNNVALAFTIDEEIFKTGANALAEKQMPSFGWKPMGVIVGEPTMLKPVIAHNGCVRWKIHTHGVACHSSNPANGRSAISMMCRVIDAVESKYIPSLNKRHPMTGKNQCSINVIRGGSQVNIIPDHCEVQLDRRLIPGETGLDVVPAIQAIIDDLVKADPNLKVSQDKPFIDPPLDSKGNEKFLGFVQGALQSMNRPADAAGVFYGTDASNIAAAGVQVLVLGPGDIKQAHTCDEWLELEQLDGAVEVYLNFMRTPLKG